MGNVICAAFGNAACDTNADGDLGYTYNAVNRMGTVSKDVVLQARYTYNHLGRQVKREVDSGIIGGCITSLTGTPFDLDGNRIAEYEVGGASPVLLREYIWHEGKPVAVVENDQVYYVRTDHIGRHVLATDSTGATVWQATYLPFGGVHTSSGDLMNLRFPALAVCPKPLPRSGPVVSG